MHLRLALLFLLAAALGCSSSKVVRPTPTTPVLGLRQNGPTHFHSWMHSPLRATDYEPMRFSVSATSDVGLRSATLYVYEYELYLNDAGLHSQRQREGGTWGKVEQFDFVRSPRSFETDYDLDAGFGPRTRLEYIWRMTDINGAVTDRLGITDVGESPWPQDKVLLFAASRAPMSELIDIAFFRDVDYGDDLARYRADIEGMVTEGFLSPSAYGNRRRHWAFYTTDRSADGRALSADITNDALVPAFLKDFSIPGIDAFCLVHREDYTDRSLMMENFHSLSNNLFSAEAQNWGTAVHESGHAIFHLSDEYEGCACFQSHAENNVFRERADCVRWNLANGFPATDCYQLADAYQRTWWSAEEPTFFGDARACREHNERNGLSPDSCRLFVDEVGREHFWAFESTCIMHDDGDDVVRPYQRACRRVIERQYRELDAPADRRGFAQVDRQNIYGYEPVLTLAMRRAGTEWSVELDEVRHGVPTASHQAAGEVTMRVMDREGRQLAGYQLANAGAVHRHGPQDDYRVPEVGAVRLSIPASAAIERISCEYNAGAHARTADPRPSVYSSGFTFEVGKEARSLLTAFETAVRR